MSKRRPFTYRYFQGIDENYKIIDYFTLRPLLIRLNFTNMFTVNSTKNIYLNQLLIHIYIYMYFHISILFISVYCLFMPFYTVYYYLYPDPDNNNMSYQVSFPTLNDIYAYMHWRHWHMLSSTWELKYTCTLCTYICMYVHRQEFLFHLFISSEWKMESSALNCERKQLRFSFSNLLYTQKFQSVHSPHKNIFPGNSITFNNAVYPIYHGITKIFPRLKRLYRELNE
jgi:hypothetical protein